jgi:hypothetical protein
MYIGKTTLLIFASVLIALGFVLRAFLPQGWLVPWGWPLGSHWYHLNWVAFRACLVAGIIIGMVAILKALVSAR